MQIREIIQNDNRAMEFDTNAGKICVSKERDLYNSIKKKYTKVAESVTEIFAEKYASYRNANDILMMSLDDFLSSVEVAILELKKDLISMDRYDLDDRTILEYIEEHQYFAPFYLESDAINEKILAIGQDLEANKAYRQARKDSRSRWVGGTIGGDVFADYNHQLKMGMRNAAEGAAHSLFNAVGNKFDKMLANSELKSIFKDKANKEKMLSGVYTSVFNLHMALVDLLKDYTDIDINDFPSDKDCDTAQRLLNNIESNVVPQEKVNELYLQILHLNPYNLDVYVSMMKRFGDSENQMGTIAKYFGVGLDAVKDNIAYEFVKVNQGETEDDAIVAKEKLVAFCNDISLEVSVELKCMQYINQRLEEFDLAYRTVDGIACSSREGADFAREELPKIQDFMKQISEPTQDALLDYEENLLIKKEEFSQIFTSELKEKYLGILEKYLKDFDTKFCSMGLFKSGTRKEAGVFKANKFVKGLKIASESDYEQAYEQMQSLLPKWGITEDDAVESFMLLKKKADSLNKKKNARNVSTASDVNTASDASAVSDVSTASDVNTVSNANTASNDTVDAGKSTKSKGIVLGLIGVLIIVIVLAVVLLGKGEGERIDNLPEATSEQNVKESSVESNNALDENDSAILNLASKEVMEEETVLEEMPVEQKPEIEDVQDNLGVNATNGGEGYASVQSEEEQTYMVEHIVIPAYEQYVSENFPNMYFEPYSFIYLNDDSIPELVVKGDCEATGYLICTYINDSVVGVNTSRWNFSFIERQNLLCNSDGNMGYFYDVVCSIQDGAFVSVAEGWSEPVLDGEGYYLYDASDNLLSKYYWNGQEVLKEDYDKNLMQVFSNENAISSYDLYYYFTIQDAYEKICKPY